MGRSNYTNIVRYSACLLVSICLLGLVNYVDFQETHCCDRIVNYGLPFTVLREGATFSGYLVREVVLRGLIADCLTALALAAVFAQAWKLWAERRSK